MAWDFENVNEILSLLLVPHCHEDLGDLHLAYLNCYYTNPTTSKIEKNSLEISGNQEAATLLLLT